MGLVYRFLGPLQAFVTCIFALILLAGCGQVVTVAPTPAPSPTATLDVAMVAATVPPTATPAPLTPAPTATPTITPTPVTHTVASGESLLALADRYAVSVALLQEANGILDPRALQIGQELIIPNEEEPAVQAALTPTPTPMPAQVENLHLVETNTGGLWVMGEIVNQSQALMEQVRGGMALLDGSGATLVRPKRSAHSIWCAPARLRHLRSCWTAHRRTSTAMQPMWPVPCLVTPAATTAILRCVKCRAARWVMCHMPFRRRL